MSKQHTDTAIVSAHDAHPLSLGKYVVGFVASVALTLAAYLLVTGSSWSSNTVIMIIAALAIVQFLVQMVFFLHVADESGPRWKLGVMWFMLGIVVILVLGSIWIMNNLDYRMMHNPRATEEYLKSQDGL